MSELNGTNAKIERSQSPTNLGKRKRMQSSEPVEIEQPVPVIQQILPPILRLLER